MKWNVLTLLIILFSAAAAFAQLAQGPSNGSVPAGVILSTPTFLDMSGNSLSSYVKVPRNEEEEEVEPYEDYLNKISASAPEGSNYVENSSGTTNSPLLLKSFPGAQDQGNTIPPDTYIASGPTNIMGVDNNFFYIWDKSGNLINKISGNAWYSTVLAGASAFDPKISYDQLSKRWIMVWLDQDDPSARGYYLVSVSDDSIPMGTWYNWAIKSSLNGSTESGTWGDYQGVGFDNQAIYLTSNSFAFTGGFLGAKIRIIGKEQLYNNTAGPLVWTDFWDVRDPGNLGARAITIRPSVMYETAPSYFLLAASPFSTGTNVLLYKITNPLSSPVLTGVDLPVTTYSVPPNANQLGGSSLLIEAGGKDFRNEPKYRNGNLFAVHSVASGGGIYSAVSYLRINPNTDAVLEDYSFGQDGFWHLFPAISVDKNLNIAMTFSRSGLTSFIGAYYNSRLNSDPPGTFSGIKTIKAGEGNYVKDFGSGRNRWGDYMGIWPDPTDDFNIWMHTEYAKPSNTWANQIALIRLVPFTTARLYESKDSLNFGTNEFNVPGDTQAVSLYNYGSPILNISAISSPGSQFQILNPPSLPANLSFRDSVYLKIVFRPTIAGNIKDSIRIVSNDPVKPVQYVYLSGKGFVINPVSVNTLYGVTGTQSGGILLTLNPSSGSGTSVGASGFSSLVGLSVRPSDNILYATIPSTPVSQLMRVNASAGDAYPVQLLPLSNIRSIAFDLNGQLFCSSPDGKLYRYDLSTRDTFFIGNTGITNFYGMSINPINNSLWGISFSGALYKINKSTGATQNIGSTGISPSTGLAFTKQGNLFAVSGIGATISKLISVDTSTGTGTLIGTNTGFAGINGLAVSPEIVGIQNISSTVPETFELFQNYPNPFNPSTIIKFALPNSEKVQLIIYDMLGKEVTKLVNEKLNAGSYEYKWDAASLPSGVYFYRLLSGSVNLTRRMVLVK